VEVISWEGFRREEKIALAQLYVPYLALGKFLAKFVVIVKDKHDINMSSAIAVGMGLDMFLRLEKRFGEYGKEKVG